MQPLAGGKLRIVRPPPSEEKEEARGPKPKLKKVGAKTPKKNAPKIKGESH
jgi:hypothetical protein